MESTGSYFLEEEAPAVYKSMASVIQVSRVLTQRVERHRWSTEGLALRDGSGGGVDGEDCQDAV